MFLLPDLWRTGQLDISRGEQRLGVSHPKRRNPLQRAPKGVIDFMLIECMLWGRAQGFRWFSLGMAPLSGLEAHPLAPAWHRVGNFIFRHGEHFYNFEGLRRYKAKFEPTWEPRYLVARGGIALPRVLVDVSVLIAGGMKELFAR